MIGRRPSLHVIASQRTVLPAPARAVTEMRGVG
jgi:hypothetical protein